MQGFLLRIIQRQLQRLALGATLGMVVITTAAVVRGELENPAIEEASLAAAKLVTGGGCESRDEDSNAAPTRRDTRDRTGAALSCAAGDLDLGDHSRRAGKPADRVIPKQRN